ncbi:acylase [Zobellia galactanivorans]|uniref:Glutaryl-7-aminocephalosporanic-acid acylase, family S45 n=1 Tax=Zobellia galactanivorans (strain DSM 12802 / CCUG 47099 / CIP 106680 / NCIMB 13871 / Dsij) TaxID=63186 RepID=G0L3B6_ZOBGA|nr:acylase [Zobellia galactanivorans]CAZ95339.1 Glutaryl-7-aminocephalosporanic-acid acylase, family S45 [Zobellia galactanivorans]
MNRIPYFFAFLLILACKPETTGTSEEEQWKARAENVEIIRDDFGVPHIYGKTDADAVFGLLYAQCEDDFNRVEQNYIWATGRLAEVEGEEAIYSDLRAKLFMTEEEAKANYKKSPKWLQELCDAFADGINYYLYTHPEVKPKLLDRFEPWMPMYFSEGSIGGDIERIAAKKIKAFYDSGMELPEMELLEMKKKKEMEEPQGSNGIALSGKLTQSGNTMLLINPHTSFYFRGEVHVVSEEGLNAYGAVTWGQFFVYQGFNEKTGWMHTSTYTDVMDEFKETIVKKEDKLLYQYGEELREVESYEIVLKYKDGDSLKEKSFPAYRTHHGPITHLVDGQWTASAMMWEPVKALEQSYIRTKQEGYKGFRDMMDIRTNSSNNTVYADAEGNIAYFHGNFVPKRDVQFNYSEPVDGSDPRTDWQGLHTVDENISVLNPVNGWIQNCNSTPFTSAAEFSPKKEDYPYYMSRDQENFRGVHAIALLTDRKGYTLDSLIQLAHDPYLPAFKALIPGLVKAYDAHPKPNLKEAIEVLRGWDYRTSKTSEAMTLAHFYGTISYQKAKRPKGLNSMELIEFWGSDSPDTEKLGLFEEVVGNLETDFGSWKIPWGEINRYQRLNGDIKQAFNDSLPSVGVGFASGTWGALAAFGARYTAPGAKKIYGTRGNSFVAAVEFGDKVKAKTILAGGQSGNPKSPHFDDQTEKYINIDWKDAAYYREDVLKHSVKIYTPGAGE